MLCYWMSLLEPRQFIFESSLLKVWLYLWQAKSGNGHSNNKVSGVRKLHNYVIFSQQVLGWNLLMSLTSPWFCTVLWSIYLASGLHTDRSSDFVGWYKASNLHTDSLVSWVVGIIQRLQLAHWPDLSFCWYDIKWVTCTLKGTVTLLSWYKARSLHTDALPTWRNNLLTSFSDPKENELVITYFSSICLSVLNSRLRLENRQDINIVTAQRINTIENAKTKIKVSVYHNSSLHTGEIYLHLFVGVYVPAGVFPCVCHRHSYSSFFFLANLPNLPKGVLLTPST